MEKSPNMVTGTLRVSNFNAYALLDPGANMSFITPYLTIIYDVSPKFL